MLYIIVAYEEIVCNTWGNNIVDNEDQVRIEYLLHEVLTETTLAQPIMSSLSFVLAYVVSRRCWS